MLAGTVGGLLQDVLAGEIVGVGRPGQDARRVCRRASSAPSSSLTRPQARTIIVAAATVVHRLLILALTALIDQHWPGVSWGAMLAETGINTLAAFVAFQATESLPGAVDRQRHESPRAAEPAAMVMVGRHADVRSVRGPPDQPGTAAGSAHRRWSSASALLAVAFWLLQVVAAQQVRGAGGQQSPRARFPLRAPRGVLFDRNGRVLVENTYSFTIAHRPRADHGPRRRPIRAAGGGDRRRPRRSVRDAVQAAHRASRCSGRIPVIEHATFAQVAAVTARQLELPEIVVQQVPTRTYPEAAWRRTCSATSARFRSRSCGGPSSPELQAGAIVGQAGLEKVYNDELHGHRRQPARRRQQPSAARSRSSSKHDPLDGERLQLTIDFDLQQRARGRLQRRRDSPGAGVPPRSPTRAKCSR